MQAPENAREQLEALAREHGVLNTREDPTVELWIIELALAHLDLQAAASEAVTWHQESVRSYTAHLGALYVGTVRDWTPYAQLFQDPSEILAKPWRATFSSEGDGEFGLGCHATEAEAKAAVERKAAETFSALLLAGERRGLERAAAWHDAIADKLNADPVGQRSYIRAHRRFAAALRALTAGEIAPPPAADAKEGQTR